jgi:HK97 family phage major capsid protein
VLESRDFITAIAHLPAELYPVPTFPRHGSRLLDHLQGIQIDTASLEYIQVNSVTGAAGIVGEGAVKPEIVMPATKLICTALKLACHAGVSWENVSDYDTFVTAVRSELMARVIDLENAQLLVGNPASGGLNGLLTTPGILTYPATGVEQNYDDIAGAIAHLRTGPALATPDLLLLHPDTWSILRTQKDLQGRYYVAADPSVDQVEQVWGVPVLQSTQFIPGQGVLLDTTLVGRVAIREAMVLRVGFSGDDFVRNIVRSIAEERLNLAVERPAAICLITGLPTSGVVAEDETRTTKRSSSKTKE